MEPALKLSGQPVKRGTMAHEHIVYMMLVDAAARAGDEAAIKQFAPKLEELAVRDNHEPYLAVAHRAWGVAHRLVGDYGKAEERFAAGLQIFERIGTQWQAARTLFEMGELALVKGEDESAQNRFSQAQELFEQLGAGPDIARTQAKIKSFI